MKVYPVKPWGACALDGADPAALHTGLRLTDLAESRTEDDRLLITAYFHLREPNPLHRAAVLQRLMGWAGGTMLRVHYRPGQQLRVRLTGTGGAGSLARWNEPIRFSWAGLTPYWQSSGLFAAEDGQPNTVHALRLRLPKTELPCPLELRLRNHGSAALNRAVLRTDRSRLLLEGLKLPPNAALTVSHDEAGLLTLLADHRSCFACRDLRSSDDLLTTDGSLTVETDQPSTLRATGRGQYR